MICLCNNLIFISIAEKPRGIAITAIEEASPQILFMRIKMIFNPVYACMIDTG